MELIICFGKICPGVVSGIVNLFLLLGFPECRDMKILLLKGVPICFLHFVKYSGDKYGVCGRPDLVEI